LAAASASIDACFARGDFLSPDIEKAQESATKIQLEKAAMDLKNKEIDISMLKALDECEKLSAALGRAYKQGDYGATLSATKEKTKKSLFSLAVLWKIDIPGLKKSSDSTGLSSSTASDSPLRPKNASKAHGVADRRSPPGTSSSVGLGKAHGNNGLISDARGFGGSNFDVRGGAANNTDYGRKKRPDSPPSPSIQSSPPSVLPFLKGRLADRLSSMRAENSAVSSIATLVTERG
jgi:hypothetical protein